jgi:hypothetical protein
LIAIAALAAAPVVVAEPGETLMWIARDGFDRNAALDAGVPLIAETEDGFFAFGDGASISAAARTLGAAAESVSVSDPESRVALVALRPGASENNLVAACGDVVWRGDGWLLVASTRLELPMCRESSDWHLRPLSMEPLLPFREPPAEIAGRESAGEQLTPDPLIQEMVDRLDDSTTLTHGQWVVDLASTRYSTSTGCDDAATGVHALFDTLGLAPAYQYHTTGHAPNVVGTITGTTAPDEVVIAIGHLDDLPSSGPAPGADDNASGTAMVTALAEAMSCYSWGRTVKFLAVTGEEFGLYGSTHYASQAQTAGEDIVAVLNADMIGWEGDGLPAAEDLDINVNSGSAWLGTLMSQAADEYGTGLVVNDFSCASMTYSDHAPFWQRGWSAVCGITDNEGFCGEGGNYPFYHTSNDTIANCGAGGPSFQAAAVRTYLATLAHLAQPVAAVAPPPTGVVAVPNGANSISLSWDAMGAGFTYQISRSPGGCGSPGPGVPLGDTGLTSFTDTTASGGVPYAYWIRGAEPGGCVSSPSVCVEATTTGTCFEPPWFAGATDASTPGLETCLLNVSWDPPLATYCGGPAVFNVYRSTDPAFTPSPASLIAANVAGIGFQDADVVFEEDYTYVVRAVDLANGVEDDNTVRVTSSPTGPSVLGAWSDDAGDSTGPALTTEGPWNVASSGGHSGPAVYATGAYYSAYCAEITSPPVDLHATSSLGFWTRFDIEDDWDKGEVQISTDAGSTWQRVPLTYPGTANQDNDACGLPSGTYFTGTAGAWTEYTADLGAWAGENAMVRWQFSSDSYVGGDGWWVDDITITDVPIPGSCFSSIGLIFADGFESGTTGAWGD